MAWRFILGLAVVVVASGKLSASNDSAAEFEFFERRVRPLLVKHCFECHADESDSLGGNLRLDSRSGWQRGGDRGPAIVPGSPQQSLLIQAVRRTQDALQMPPDDALPPADVRILVQWVALGAPDPRTTQPVRSASAVIDEARDFWAFQSLRDESHTLPIVQRKTWPRNELDYFILAELEPRHLVPTSRAAKRTLIRRATFDLTGLPPSPGEVHRFLGDSSPQAFERVVERLLASPRYGERWGRFWLDVARYADSNGLDENIAHGNAWRYRDYVIQSFNHDKPYSEFVTQQLAGDLLTPTTASQSVELPIATGFLSLGPKVLAEVDETKMEMDIVDEQVDTVGRAFLGLTLGCARCHDHKFDPIRSEDYYSLAGIFKSTKTMEHFTKIARWNEIVISNSATQQRHAELSEKLAAAQKSLKDLQSVQKEKSTGCDAECVNQQENLKAEIKRLEAELPVLETAMAVTDYEEPTNLPIHVRGSHLSKGATVARGFPAVLTPSDAEPDIPDNASGRLELARWLTDGRHPLTARVMANRVWRWHFGRGLVDTPDNFGRLGSRPINQALLDWLASRLVQDDWSLKALHRRIMLSATYQLSSSASEKNVKADPDNRYQSRFSLRRLEAEAVRDTILMVAGLLDGRPGGSLLPVKNREFLFDHTSIDNTRYDSTVRSVYLPVIRNHLYDGFQLFDYTDASVVNGDRSTTVVAPQALFFLNSGLLQEAANAFADRVLHAERETANRVQFAYELAFNRPATKDELATAGDFLAATIPSTGQVSGERPAWSLFCHALLMSDEFIYVQ